MGLAWRKMPVRRRHVTWWAMLATVLGALILAASAVTLSAVPARAAGQTLTFAVNSLQFGSGTADANPGDGTCATSAGVCTLRAAVEEANDLGATNTVTVTVADGFAGGTITGDGPRTAANWMSTSTLTDQGDSGAYYTVTAPMTIDLKNKIGITSASDSYGAAAFFVNRPDVTIRNFTSIMSNETSFVVSSAGTGATIENGSALQSTAYNLERFLWLQDGATATTVRNVRMGGLYSGGIGAIVVASSATVADLTLDKVTMTRPSSLTGSCAGTACLYNGFATRGGATIDGLTITNSTFEQFGYGDVPISLVGANVSGLDITGNTFRANSTGSAEAYALLLLPTDRAMTGTNDIRDNVFDNSGVATDSNRTDYAIYWNGPYGANSTTASNLSIQDNSFDGFGDASTASVRMYQTGSVTIQRNTFGTSSASRPSTAEEETSTTRVMVNNYDSSSNRKIATWYPTNASVTDSCVLGATVEVSASGTGTQPAAPVYLDVYATTGSAAEVYLGRVGPLTAAGSVTVPHTVGGDGYLRVQTIGAAPVTGGQQESSQYSRAVAFSAPDTCGPRVTVDQAAAQADPTSVRSVSFTVTASEALATDGPGALTASDFETSASTAPGVTVTSVIKLSDTRYTVTAQADDSGTIVLSLPAGAVTDAAGNPSNASTSTDNQVTYQNPLSISPTQLTVTEGQAGATYTVTNALSATAPISVATSGWSSSWVTLDPDPIALSTSDTSRTITVSAIDDGLVNGTRSTTIAHTVASTDPNFDGLLLSPVSVTVIDDDSAAVSIDKRGFTLDEGQSAPTSADDLLTGNAGTEVGTGISGHETVAAGTTVYWTYTVTNTGTVPLTDLVVTDDQYSGGSPAGRVCAIDTLAAGASRSCLASGTVGTP